METAELFAEARARAAQVLIVWSEGGALRWELIGPLCAAVIALDLVPAEEPGTMRDSDGLVWYSAAWL
jgi:hypothetical protein